MAPAIVLNKLTKYFSPGFISGNIFRSASDKKDRIIALQDVSFEVGQGEIFCLIGPNGAGKTTLLKILSSLVLPSSGEALVAGYDVVKDSIAVRNNIGLVSGEERSFYWRISGRQNLEFFASFYNVPKDQTQKRIQELIDLLDIHEPDRVVAKYSSGMKQRLALARALLHDPPVLLMDEPTKSLDPGSVKKFQKTIRDYLCQQQEKTILWATHNLHEAEKICDRVGVICDGRLAAIGTKRELRASAGLGEEATLDDVFEVVSNPKMEESNV